MVGEMRWTLALSFVSLLWTSACFEDTPPPPAGPGTADGMDSECSPGAEGCECLEGECVGELSCLSNVCVDANATAMTTTTAGATGGGSSSGSVDEGPADTGSLTTSGGDLPAGAQCDPVFDLCEAGLACIQPDLDGFVCAEAGPVQLNEPCSAVPCAAGLICYDGNALGCGGNGCCTTFCDLFEPDGWCADGFVCSPFYPGAKAPPGYEHVGVCIL